MLLKGGKSYQSSDFHFDIRTRHLTARALNWVFDFYFSSDFESIEKGTCHNEATSTIRSYGLGTNQVFYKRVHDSHFMRQAKSSLSEPTLYFVHGDQTAFIFCEQTFVVIMDGQEYVSSDYQFDASTRHVMAKAHKWHLDFNFSRDYSFVEKGHCTNVHSGETFHFGSALGQLFVEKDMGGGTKIICGHSTFALCVHEYNSVFVCL